MIIIDLTACNTHSEMKQKFIDTLRNEMSNYSNICKIVGNEQFTMVLTGVDKFTLLDKQKTKEVYKSGILDGIDIYLNPKMQWIEVEFYIYSISGVCLQSFKTSSNGDII